MKLLIAGQEITGTIYADDRNVQVYRYLRASVRICSSPS